jgi:hypothetical protein
VEVPPPEVVHTRYQPILSRRVDEPSGQVAELREPLGALGNRVVVAVALRWPVCGGVIIIVAVVIAVIIETVVI